jgi:hypothetical protein
MNDLRDLDALHLAGGDDGDVKNNGVEFSRIGRRGLRLDDAKAATRKTLVVFAFLGTGKPT